MTVSESNIFKTLTSKVNNARDEYLKLRDAKSNGCCHGMSISQVMVYDSKILKAYNTYAEVQKQYETFLQGLS